MEELQLEVEKVNKKNTVTVSHNLKVVEPDAKAKENADDRKWRLPVSVCRS